MAKSLSQLRSQLHRLQKEVASIEVGVVNRIKKEIAKHGLTVEHLFGSSPAAAPAPTASSKSAVKPGAKFADEHGNSWSGFGPKPRWIREAIEAGHSIQEFQGNISQISAPTKSKAASKAAPESAKSPKFADGTGNTWGGMGKRPIWLREALDSGKSLDDFLVTKSAANVAAPTKKAAKALPTSTPGSKAGKTEVPSEKPATKAKPKATPVAKKSVATESAAKVDGPAKSTPVKAPAAKKVAAAKVAKAPPAAAKKAKAKSAQPKVSNAAKATTDEATTVAASNS